MARILITDGEQRAALAIVRSLGSAGHDCIVAGSSGRSLAGASRYSQRELAVPHAGRAPRDFVRAIADTVANHRIDIVIPVTEETILALLPERDSVGAIIPFTGIETFRSICDKECVLEAARGEGIRVPRQTTLHSPDDAHAIDSRFPLVLKPARSVFTAGDGTRGKAVVRWVHRPDQLMAAIREFPAEAYPILAQEAIEGPGIGVFLLVHDGRSLASFSHRRLREKPPSGGVSVLCRSEPLDAELHERSLALLNRFGWSGVAMVEYKRDRNTGEPVLMEINGRFWGSLQLAIDAGVDFPRLLVDHALGAAPARAPGYKRVTARWLWGDVDNLIARLRDPQGTIRTRFTAIAEWLGAFGPGNRNEVFRTRDPRPALRETMQWFRSVLRS